MPTLIDRRLNPKDKSLDNRQRFLKRARAQLKEAINDAVRRRDIADMGGKHDIVVRGNGVSEPRFRHADAGGHRQGVLPGNKEFTAGDRLPKPPGGGAGVGGRQASDSGDADDDFRFVLSRDDFLDLFFDDLELPDMVKASLKEVMTFRPRRAGFAMSGTPTGINVLRTMRNSYGRRLALGRPRQEAIDEVEREIAALEDQPEPTLFVRDRLAELRETLERMNRKRRVVPFLDPVDVRYNRYEAHPVPNANAVMFCLMDVSGSMGEREKDLAKRFFVLLHLFLKRRYERIDIVFIRHTHVAQAVDEQTFFHSVETGGTVVSTALEEMRRIVRERYPPNEWNIYAAQVSDGDNFAGDSEKCVRLLNEDLMRLCQYYAYVEILDEREADIFRTTENGTPLWRAFRTVLDVWPHFQMSRIARPGDIYPVFRALFLRNARGRAGT